MQRLGNGIGNPDRRIAVAAPLQPGNIGPMKSGAMGKFFLRHLLRPADAPDVRCENDADVLLDHAPL